MATETQIDQRINSEPQKCPNGETLHNAALSGDLELIRLCLDAGIDVNYKDEFGRTSVFFASRDGNLDALQLLLEAKGNPVEPKHNGTMPIFVAAQNGHHAVVCLLIESNADPGSMAADGATPVMMAAQIGHEEIIAELIKHKVDVNVPLRDPRDDCDGLTAIHSASIQGNVRCVEMLLEAHANLDSSFAVDKETGVTPLHIAAKFGNHQVVKKLIEMKANANATTSCQRTALHFAAENWEDESSCMKTIEALVYVGLARLTAEDEVIKKKLKKFRNFDIFAKKLRKKVIQAGTVAKGYCPPETKIFAMLEEMEVMGADEDILIK